MSVVRCYICQPDNPNAAEEGCGACDQEYWARVLREAGKRPCRYCGDDTCDGSALCC